ncbi:hypothetical protein CAPTEDRAFT_219683 [Capitella teleta]|uniref:SHSP domain-containing protein n=1 Tax=Capitella teleta TaxID=283909 RepID=R7U422_CAPTE|nr:hypothetical protein CAPTEDRAFT_219683 [Capitella teleta]|eukprot:ELU01095.1 hypothetical protein CAPTEDRAFT_219683 [Capitella teleta]
MTDMRYGLDQRYEAGTGPTTLSVRRCFVSRRQCNVCVRWCDVRIAHSLKGADGNLSFIPMSKSKQEHRDSKAAIAADKIFINLNQPFEKMPCGKKNRCAERKERGPGCRRGPFGPWMAGPPPHHYGGRWFGPPHHPHGHPMGGPGGCWGPPHHPKPWGQRHGCGRWGRGPPPHVVERLMKKWAEKAEEREDQTSGDDSGNDGAEEAPGPCMGGGPPAHVMAHFMEMSSGNYGSEQRQDANGGVKKAEKPIGADEAGSARPGMCWKQWMQAGQGPEVWFRVVKLPNVNQEGAQVKVVGQKLVVQAGPNDDSSSSDEGSERQQQSIDLPTRIITRTLRTTWLGPHRLLAFGLKKLKQDAEKEETSKEQDDVGCWFHSVQIPGVHQAQLNVDVVDGKIVFHAFKESHNEETGDLDRMEAKRTIAMPEDIRKRTLRWARMGPMRLCLFALRKKKEQEVMREERDQENEDIEMKEHEAEIGNSQAEDVEWVELKAADFSTEVDVRGFQYEDLSVSREKNAVIVNAKRREEDGERSLRKTILLPDDIRVESIRCSLDENLLRITAQRSLTPVYVDDVADDLASIRVDVDSNLNDVIF